MSNVARFLLLIVTLSLMSVFTSTTVFADNDPDRTQVGRSISLGPGEEGGDLTCFGCNIRVRGHASGDVTTFGGSIMIEDQGKVDGDTTAFAGSIRLEKEVEVGGDVTAFGGRVRREPAATVRGEVTSFGGPGWILLIVVLPVVLIGLLVAVVVWLIGRLLRPRAPAAA